MSRKPQHPLKARPPTSRQVRKTPPTTSAVSRRSPTHPPTGPEVQQVAATLDPSDRDAFHRILALLETHLGSPEAARLWLVTPSPEFEATPLTAVIQARAKFVLALLESRWGPGPAHA